MTQRQAKQLACRHAALILETGIGGMDPEPEHIDEDGNWNADGKRYQAAVQELIDELGRRGGP
jgi:hypothetical protein